MTLFRRRCIAAALRVCLLLLPLGIVLSMWPWSAPEIINVAGYNYPLQPPLSGVDDPRLARRSSESDLTYAKRANTTIYESVYHCGSMGLTQSWLITLVSTLVPEEWLRFPGARLGVLVPARMRCGICSQVSHLLNRALHANGIVDAKTSGLDGHVVVLMKIDGKMYVVDPDYGVGPFYVSWDNPEKLSRIILTAYQGVLQERGFSNTLAEYIRDIYVTPVDGRMYSEWQAPDYLALLEHYQSHWFGWERMTEWTLMGTGSMALLLLLFRRYRHHGKYGV